LIWAMSIIPPIDFIEHIDFPPRAVNLAKENNHA